MFQRCYYEFFDGLPGKHKSKIWMAMKIMTDWLEKFDKKIKFIKL